jgi:hypothetical protein
MGETRVNLKHLLEDIRDSYPFPVEEAILTELVANALDSGASEIRLSASPRQRTLTIVDNGKGMTAPQLDRYHDIAATTKERGKGIGFAGIGAKLALLVAHAVITETKSGRSYNATRWRLESHQRAPWELIEPADLIEGAHGTAVMLQFSDASPLTEWRYLEIILQAHFHPLLDEAFQPIVQLLYPAGIRFWINQRLLKAIPIEGLREQRIFGVYSAGTRKAVGIGFIGISHDELPEPQRGIGIAAYGKVIKRGWDWLGLTPKHPQQVTGIVEAPALAEILTTNKADFLKDSGSLKKYYRHRKAIQTAIEPILREFGESAPTRERTARDVRPLEREVEQVLGNLLHDYPEIAPLVGRRRTNQPGLNLTPEPNAPTLAFVTETLQEIALQAEGSVPLAQMERSTTELAGAGVVLEASEDGDMGAKWREGKRVGPGLMIGFEDAAERSELGWLMENTIWINRAHPAYQKAATAGHETYHMVLCVVWVLLGHLDDRHSAQQFIGQFLSGWGARGKL